jgi:hypothetical protein
MKSSLRAINIALSAFMATMLCNLPAPPPRCLADEFKTATLDQNGNAAQARLSLSASGKHVGEKRLDYKRMRVFSAGVHRFEEDHLHPGRQSVVAQDLSLIKTLSQQGVPDDHIVALRDEDATTINCQNQLKELLKNSSPGEFLLVFIHSHGSLNRGGLVCTYEKGGVWTYQDLVKEIEDNFKGDSACICIGACHSGSLLDVIKSAPRRISYFGVTSVFPALNAKTVATADFEVCIKDAFGGAPCPDFNEDGVITFDEFGRYISDDQRRLFLTVPEFGYTDNFDPQTIITNAREHSGPLDCALVQLPDGVRGRVVKQDDDRVLVRGSRNPRMVQWVRSERVMRIP